MIFYQCCHTVLTKHKNIIEYIDKPKKRKKLKEVCNIYVQGESTPTNYLKFQNIKIKPGKEKSINTDSNYFVKRVFTIYKEGFNKFVRDNT